MNARTVVVVGLGFAAMAAVITLLVTSLPGTPAPGPAVDEGNLASLRARVDALERGISTVGERPTAVAPVPAGGDDATADAVTALTERLAALEAEVAELRGAGLTIEEERQEIAAMSDEELAAHARAIQKGGGASAQALRAWQSLLDRSPSLETRDAALFELGVLARELGDPEKSAAAFRQLMDLAVPGSERVAEARYQLAWTFASTDDSAAAMREMEAVAADPAASATLRGHARTNGAQFALQSAEPARARALLDQAVADLSASDDPMHKWIVNRAKEMLAAMAK